MDISATFVDVKEDFISVDDLKCWHELSGLDIKKFFNTSGLVYKSMNLKDNLVNYTYEEQLTLLSENGMLIKRPILVGDDFVYVGRGILKELKK